MKFLLKSAFFLLFGILGSLPIFKTGFLSEHVDDAFYYYSRTNEFINGYWQIGNPYFYEHRNDLGISFFIPDWLSAIPASFFVWPVITALLIYILLRSLKISGKLLYLGTLFCFLTVYNFIVRPTSLATIYPFFLLLLIAIRSKSTPLIVISAVLSFYIYPYLWQLAIGVLVLYSLTTKFNKKILWVIPLATPALYYLYLQLNSPYYWETMERIALVYTRIPTVAAFFYFGILSVPMFFCRREKFLLIFYLAFSFLLFSNVITGKELEIANHVGRFAILFGSICIVYLISRSKIFIALAIFWLFVFRSNYSVLNLNFPQSPNYNFQRLNNIPKPKVIKAEGEINSLIPFWTKHYVLFHPMGGLHLMSSDELLERYLVWKYPEKLTIPILIQDFRDYAGTGPAIHKVANYNYQVRLCQLFHLPNCAEVKDTLSFYKEDYFQKILDRYEKDIFPNIDKYYQKYQVVLLDELPR